MLYIALLHYPVYNKDGKTVTTAIANMDLHDISRVAKTYAAEGVYIVNPAEKQRQLAQEIIDHWRTGHGADCNPDRRAAFELLIIKESVQEVLEDVLEKTGIRPKIVVTGAQFSGGVLKFTDLRHRLIENRVPHVLIFGTGSGIAREVIEMADDRLEPIQGPSDYNHLSVRSAVAIILDKIM
jgi:hypothetical protein